jgi:D-alanyl-D-alanine carboxypeptidase/D-alanyl-D-alanine-endopeptidase (penicillin-binding protein 4)
VADSLHDLGITTINGNVLIDPKGFNDSEIGAGWKEENRYYSYSAKPSVLPFYENCVQFKITPSGIGKKPGISAYPVNSGFEIINKMNTIGQNRQGISFDLDHETNQITFYGNVWHRSKPHYRTLALQRPDLYALEVVKKKLNEHGINISGDVLYASNLDVSKEKLFSIESDKFIDVLNETNKKSNNFMANQLFLTLGNEYEAPHKTEHLIKYWLSENNISTDSLRMFDGSGLSILNTCTVNILSDVLKLMYHSPDFIDFHNSMSISGREGTLKNSLSNRKLYDKVYAKTGFIIGARALSGYIETLDNEMLAFSFIINKEGSHIRNFYSICERIMLELAQFRKDNLSIEELPEIEVFDDDYIPFDWVDEVIPLFDE